MELSFIRKPLKSSHSTTRETRCATVGRFAPRVVNFTAVIFAVPTLFAVLTVAACSTTPPVPPKPKVEKPREITIVIPDAQGIDGHPCDNPEWTKLPPKIDSPAIGSAPPTSPKPAPTPTKSPNQPSTGDNK